MNKKILLLVILVCVQTNAQSVADALRYGQTSLQGSARFTAMGGAFGAVGGDLSAIAINPASSSVFSFSEIGFSVDFDTNNNQVNYFGENATLENTSLNFSQAGYVFVLNNESVGDWTKLSIGLTYQRTHDFEDSFTLSGVNPQNGIHNYFLNYAAGNSLRDISILDGETFFDAYLAIGETAGLGYGAQQALFGYEGFVINPIPFDGSTDSTDPNIVDYQSNTVIGNNGYRHRLNATTSGKLNRYTINLSSVYQNKLHIGFNINTYNLNYKEIHDFTESGYGEGTGVDQINFNNELFTTGTGTSFQLGMIYKFSKSYRFGLTLDSPTYFRLTDRVRQNLVTERSQSAGTIRLSPEIETIFPSYDLQTPASLKTSFAYVYKDRGLFSIDYTRKNLGQSRFSPEQDDYLRYLNEEIANEYQASRVLQVGIEYRLNPQINLRYGYLKENSSIQSFDNSRKIRTLGLGYNFGPSLLDLSLVAGTSRSFNPLFTQGLTDRIELTQDQYQLVLSYRLKL